MKNLILKSICLLIISLLLSVMVQGQAKGDNTFYGTNAGYKNTTGRWNSYFGMTAGYWNETGNGNSFFGCFTGYDSDGNNNSLFGYGSETRGDENCQFGFEAGTHPTTGYTYGNGVSFFGFKAGTYNRADYSSFYGYMSGYSNTTGVANSFFGYNSGYYTTTASSNSFYGYGAGMFNTEGSYNTFFGSSAGNKNTTGEFNVFIGEKAGLWNTIGSNNVVIGARALLTGNYSIVLGADSETTASSAVVIGFDVKSTLDNTCVIGGVDTTNSLRVGIGTLEPNEMATLELGNTDKGFLISRMTTTERTIFGESLGTTEEGMMVYDMDENNLYVWGGGAWIKISNSDNQNLDLTGSTLSISDGNSVDLSSLLDDINARITVLEALHAITSNKGTIEENTAVLYQNAPNPFTYDTSVDFHIPENVFDAKLMIFDVNGTVVKQIDINQRGNGSVIITRDLIATGTYFYTLSMDNKKLDTKIMVLIE